MNAARRAFDASVLRSRSLRRRAIEFVCVLGLYLVAGKIGLAVPFTSANVSPIWPPAGIALAAFLMLGFEVWPAVALGAFAVNYFSSIPHIAAIGISVGNTLGPMCGALLIRRFTRFSSSLSRLRDVLALISFGAMCGTAVSASIGVSVLFLTSVHAWSRFGTAWLMWWLGDATGVLVFAPLLLTFTSLLRNAQARRLESGCLLLAVVCSAAAIFGPPLGLKHANIFAFGIFPFVLWGALRFEAAGSAAVSFLITAVAIWGTARGGGPFITDDPVQSATLLESFLAVISVSGIVLAAAMSERAKLIRDQTSREAVEQSEKIYRGIVETAYEGIWKLDAEFTTTFVNRRMAELLRYPVEEIIGKPLSAFLFENDIEGKWEHLHRRQTGISEQMEARYKRKDGSVLWARISASPIIGDDGRFAGALAMVSDMTDQKQQEDAERRSREMIDLLTRAVEQTDDSVVITDWQGTIEYVNPAFEATTGYTRDEAVGDTPRMLKSGLHDSSFYADLWAHILGGEAFRGTIANRKKSGELYWTEQTITPIKDSVGQITHFVSVHKDITASRKQQEQDVQFRLAREVQQRFYTSAAVSVAGFDIATAAHPAAETGGDYLDLFSLSNGCICIGIGDVSSHGLDSALVMSSTRAYVRSFAQVEHDLSRILSSVNKMLLKDLATNRYVTMLLVCLDPSTGCLSYANAGHIPGFLLNQAGEIDVVLESSGPPLGLFDGLEYVTSSCKLRPQQLLLLLTDGATESSTSEDEEFGTDGVLAYVREHRQESARDIAEGIYRASRSFAKDNPQQDDVTEVVVRVA